MLPLTCVLGYRATEKELPFSSLEATEELDDQFLARLQVAAADSQGAEEATQGRGGVARPGAAKGRNFSLAPENVRKARSGPRGCYCLYCL